MDVAAQVYDRTLALVCSAGSSRERAEAVRHAAEVLGVTPQTVYRQLKKRGWTSGRKARRDRGASAVTEDDLVAVSRLMARGRNRRGQANVPLKVAHQVARDHGLIDADVSTSHLGRMLRTAGLDRNRMLAPEPSISRVSLHPNHVWFFDISIGIQWYFRDPATGKRLDLYSDAGARFYPGKPDNFKALKRVIHRFAMTDHRSGAYFVRYYYTPGEAAEDVVDFLYRAMAPKDGVEHAYPFRGIPNRLVMDQGSANKSALVRNLLEELGVHVEYHMTGNAKASGSVESRHLHWQRTFEGRMSARPADDLAQLNGWALRSCALYNAEEPHSRHGRPPTEVWLEIADDQLVEVPDRDVFLQLASTNRRQGTLTNRLWLRADNRKWLIAGDNIYPRQKVFYRLSPWLDAGIRVWDGDEQELAATELEFDSAGFPLNGRRHVWDDDEAKGATAPLPPAQKLAKAVASGEVPVRVEGLFDDLDERLARHRYIERRGQAWTSKDTPIASEPVLGSMEARESIRNRLGRRLSREEGAWWRQRIGDGITPSDLEAAWEEFTAGAAGDVGGVTRTA